MNETKTTTALATLPVHSMTDLQTVGAAIAASGMFGIKNDASGLVVAATCHQQGITLLEFVRTYHVVNGRPSMRADAMLAEFRKIGGRYKIEENSTERAAAIFEIDGQSVTFAYTIQDAKRTGDCYDKDGKTLKHTWATRPEDMLWARMTSRAVRRLCPEIVAGLYTPEEVGDFERAPGKAPEQIDANAARARADSQSAPRPAAQHEPEPIDADATDLTTCPQGYGEYSGRAWEDMEDAVLLTVAENDDLRIYREYIINVLSERQAVRDAE
jgi:hypothetical protein